MQPDKLTPLNRSINEDLKAEERLQGHYLTGNTEKSFENRETKIPGGVILEVVASGIVSILEEGVAADKIPYDSSVRTGAKTSNYIQGLKGFAMLRFGLDEKAALSVAFAIAKKHEKEGMPTKGSSQFSSTGERLKAVQIAFSAKENQYFDKMDVIVSDDFDNEWFDEAKTNVTVIF